ncbi:Optic atrophy 1, isoform A [Cichlidogyrus casuarinus]|uniref:Dynamin-like GTPase OPA1, mitochondrial n=1 Tax=Cichlidogyrus casuarinus TaxID=1844966 RepID=A0ABD2Q4J2_9PLAT
MKTSSSENKSNASAEEVKRSSQLKDLHDQIAKAKADYLKAVEDLKKENQELRTELLLRREKHTRSRINLSLIDMYSELLDALSQLDDDYSVMDQLPRIVVIGDQSAGKTSVLEMIAQARIFPRGSGQMMTRSPVQVTLSEGAYHVASFKDSTREYDLTKESELAALRAEIERRMTALVSDGRTVSSEVISLNVKGPGLQRIVLVDLPGIISTVTAGMDPNAKNTIRKLATTHMKNPNAIILCIQDGSIDAERSNVTDLVSSIDPQGKRTIFVLTKVDLAEANLYNPNRIKQILEGRLFPMKALGYFAVVTGKGSKEETIKDIQKYEEEFFANSRLFKEGTLRLKQMTTANLSKAVSERFWKTVKDSVEQQADNYRGSLPPLAQVFTVFSSINNKILTYLFTGFLRPIHVKVLRQLLNLKDPQKFKLPWCYQTALRYNLEMEWKNTYGGLREVDREGLFERGKILLLDELSMLGAVTTKTWEDDLMDRLWSRVDDYVFEQIYNPAAENSDYGSYMTKVDIFLKDWVESKLPETAIATGCETLYYHFNEVSKQAQSPTNDEIFNDLRQHVCKQTRRQHTWNPKAHDQLLMLQRTALEDRVIHNKIQWNDTINFMNRIFDRRLQTLDEEIEKLKGPNWLRRWTRWVSRSEAQKLNLAVIQELELVIDKMAWISLELPKQDLTAVVRNLKNKHNIEVDESNNLEHLIEDLYRCLARRSLLVKAKESAKDWRTGFYYYQQGFVPGSPKQKKNGSGEAFDLNDCRDIVFFSRIRNMILSTMQALRQQITNEELGRMELLMKHVLEEIEKNPSEMRQLISGKRVQLAEDLSESSQFRHGSPSILVEGERRAETAGFSSPPTETRILGLPCRKKTLQLCFSCPKYTPDNRMIFYNF